jgi:hypothetical protein
MPSGRGRSSIRHRLDRGDRGVERDTELAGGREGGQRIEDVVLAEDPQANRAALAAGDEGEGGAARGGDDLLGAQVGIPARAEPDHTGGGLRRHLRDPGVVGVEHRDGARGESGHHLRLGALDGVHPAELARVREADLEHHADVRGHDPDQPGDLTEVARAHLDDEVPGPLVDAEHRYRRPDVVVERPLRGHRRALRLQDRAQQVLGRGLAVRPGDGRDPERAERAHPRDHLPRQVGEGDDAVRDDHLRRREFELPLRDHQRGAGLHGGRSEQRAVGVLAGQREEDRAGLHEPGVRLHRPGDDRLGAGAGREHQRAPEGARDLGEGERDHQPASRRAARASSRAEYGVRTPSMSR